ncbi:MAG: hypothetical protein ABEI07_01770 [Candidatus Nanohaloarchaea archaeon]
MEGEEPGRNRVRKDSYSTTVYPSDPLRSEPVEIEFGELDSKYVEGTEIAYRRMSIWTEEPGDSVKEILEGNLVLGEYVEEDGENVCIGMVDSEVEPADVKEKLDPVFTPVFLMEETAVSPEDIYVTD